MKKTRKETWIAKARTRAGWQELGRFDNAADANDFLDRYMEENGYTPKNGYSMADFTIKYQEA